MIHRTAVRANDGRRTVPALLTALAAVLVFLGLLLLDRLDLLEWTVRP